MRSGLIFVGAVFAASVVVFLIAVTQFTHDPFLWTVQHLDYAAAALIPVIPVAFLARLSLPRADAEATDVPSEVDTVPERPARRAAVTSTVTVEQPRPRSTKPGFASVEQLAVASVLERGLAVADVAKTLKVRPATVEMWVARARGESS